MGRFLRLGKQLDDRVMARWSWMTRPLPNWQVRIGLPWVIIFAGGLLLRLLLRPWLNTPSYLLWTFAGLALPGLLLLAFGIRSARLHRGSRDAA